MSKVRSRLCLQFACFVYTFHIKYQLMYTNIKEDKHNSQNKKMDLTWIPGGKQKVRWYNCGKRTNRTGVKVLD